MIESGKTVRVAMGISMLLVAIVGCQKQEGPAERAGKEADKATEKVGQQIENVGKSIQDTAKGDKK